MNKDIYFIRVCEIAAINSYSVIGCKNKNTVDKKAVDSIRLALKDCSAFLEIKSGEGYLDNAPMLFIGEKLGLKDSKLIFDVAIDPIENTNAAAYGKDHSIVCLSYSYKNLMKTVPETYMEKLFVNKKYRDKIDESLSMIDNVFMLQKHYRNLSLVILNKPRHKKIIKQFLSAGIKITKINDGDVVGAIGVVENKFDILYGIGGSVEGVLMSSLAISTNSYLKMKFIKYCNIWNESNDDYIKNKTEISEMKKFNFLYDKYYYSTDFIRDNQTRFVATFLTNSWNHKGVEKKNEDYIVQTFFASHGIYRTLISNYNIMFIKKMLPKISKWLI